MYQCVVHAKEVPIFKRVPFHFWNTSNLAVAKLSTWLLPYTVCVWQQDFVAYKVKLWTFWLHYILYWAFVGISLPKYCFVPMPAFMRTALFIVRNIFIAVCLFICFILIGVSLFSTLFHSYRGCELKNTHFYWPQRPKKKVWFF